MIVICVGSYFNNIQLQANHNPYRLFVDGTGIIHLNYIQYLRGLFYNCYFLMDADWMVVLDNICIRPFFDSSVVPSVVHNRLSFMDPDDSSNDGLEISSQGIGFAAIF